MPKHCPECGSIKIARLPETVSPTEYFCNTCHILLMRDDDSDVAKDYKNRTSIPMSAWAILAAR